VIIDVCDAGYCQPFAQTAVMKRKTLLSWSSGKDSAWALHLLRRCRDVEVVGLMTTVNHLYQRVAIHAVRLELLRQQAEAAGLPLQIINLPSPCSNVEYEAAMQEFVQQSKDQGIKCMAFGDLFLADIREYREAKLADSGITPLFPLWNLQTRALATQMITGGLRAVVTCVDPRQLPASFAGREFGDEFLSDLPASVDPCGERGEFHTFAFAGPMFKRALEIEVGEVRERDGFVYADVLSLAGSSSQSCAPAKIEIDA
jgi:uncharacterized protein (TIGR00290 family)